MLLLFVFYGGPVGFCLPFFMLVVLVVMVCLVVVGVVPLAVEFQ